MLRHVASSLLRNNQAIRSAPGAVRTFASVEVVPKHYNADDIANGNAPAWTAAQAELVAKNRAEAKGMDLDSILAGLEKAYSVDTEGRDEFALLKRETSAWAAQNAKVEEDYAKGKAQANDDAFFEKQKAKYMFPEIIDESRDLQRELYAECEAGKAFKFEDPNLPIFLEFMDQVEAQYKKDLPAIEAEIKESQEQMEEIHEFLAKWELSVPNDKGEYTEKEPAISEYWNLYKRVYGFDIKEHLFERARAGEWWVPAQKEEKQAEAAH